MMAIWGAVESRGKWGAVGTGIVEDGQRGSENENLPRGPARVFLNPG